MKLLKAPLLGVMLCLSSCASVPVAPVPAVSAGRVEGVPPIPERLTQRLHQYQNVRSARVLAWLGESLLISTRFGETNQVHRVDAALGARAQLTFSDEAVQGAWAGADPAAPGFIYAQDDGGAEFYQLYWFDAATSQSRRLTDGQSRHEEVVFAGDGDRFGYVRTAADGQRDVMVGTLTEPGRSVYAAGAGAWGIEAFSSDGARALLIHYISINEAELFELDVRTSVAHQLLTGRGTFAVGMARYGAADSTVFFTADMGAEFMRLHALDLGTGRIAVVTGDVPWNIDAFEVSPDRRTLAALVNEEGYSRLRVMTLPALTYVALPELPSGVAGAPLFDPSGRRLALTIASATQPSDAYVVDLSARSVTRWTKSETAGLASGSFTAPELIRYPTFDAVDGRPREIPAFLYQPEGAGPFPVVVYIHGGPESQFRPTFSAPLQFLLRDLGVAVVAPNVRGSAGYGKGYLKLDNGMLREDSVADIGALLDWIAVEPRLDANRVAVMGDSYGGFMVLASVVRYGDRLAAGTEAFGISNFVSFLENTQTYRRDLRRAEYGDERDPAMRAFLESASPLNKAAQITTPMFITQGANDPRVPASESEQIVAALKRNGTPVWYVLFEGEGHGYRRRANRDYDTAASMLFLQRYLLGGGQ